MKNKFLSGAFFFWLLACGILLSNNLTIKAQQPFVTDNTDVTAKGKFHFEAFERQDLLQRSSFPAKRQNIAAFTLAYGLLENLEISVSAPFLTIINDPRAASYHFAGGVGDSSIGVKYNFRKEKEESRIPALSVSGFVQFPTGNARKQLGSGVTDYGINGIAQKTIHKKNVARVNAGMFFAGNTFSGVEGFVARGTILTGGASLVRTFTEKLQLGVEMTGAAPSNFRLSAGQLQFQAGGNYNLRKNMTLDFGVISGRFAASPRVGGQLGVSIDF